MLIVLSTSKPYLNFRFDVALFDDAAAAAAIQKRWIAKKTSVHEDQQILNKYFSSKTALCSACIAEFIISSAVCL